MWKIVKELITTPVRYEDMGQMIVDSEENLIADIRGWGRLQYMPDAESKQDAIGKFIAEAINEKIAREKILETLNIDIDSDSEGEKNDIINNE